MGFFQTIKDKARTGVGYLKDKTSSGLSSARASAQDYFKKEKEISKARSEARFKARLSAAKREGRQSAKPLKRTSQTSQYSGFSGYGNSLLFGGGGESKPKSKDGQFNYPRFF